MIRIERISKDLGDFFLRDVTLEIQDNEYFVILGPTGAGKSILLETIAILRIVHRGSGTLVWSIRISPSSPS